MSESTSRFSFNPTEVTAGIPLLADGEYTFKIEEVKAFFRERTNTDGTTTELYGITPRLSIVEAPESEIKILNKAVFPSFFFHVESSAGMTKQFIMAAYGFNPRQEDEFNAFAKDQDWGTDFDALVLGNGYTDMAGRTVKAYVSQKPNKNDATQINQQYKWLVA